MTYVGAALAVLCFLLAFEWLGVTKAAAQAIQKSQSAVSSMKDPSVTEREREKALRRASLSLISDFLSIAARGALSVGASLLPLLAMDLAGIASFDEAVRWLATWPAILLITAIVSGGYLVKPRR